MSAIKFNEDLNFITSDENINEDQLKLSWELQIANVNNFLNKLLQ